MLANQEKLSTQVYEAPAIIYDGVISTRAGSPLGVDPDDLFDD